MSDRSLLLLLDEVRGKTLRLLEGLTQAQSLWTPAGLDNHILWHAGHAFVLVEWLMLKAVDQEPKLPHHWFDMFGWKSQPGTVPEGQWPALKVVNETLSSQHMRMHRLISGLTDEQLSAAVRTSPNHTVRYSLVHALHDEACHAGEIWLLRKMLEK